ncbi:MAG: DUF2256 domain-containing protein [Burkholderiaceae bacterium]
MGAPWGFDTRRPFEQVRPNEAMATPGKDSFRGNKGYLPSKPCSVCGREMTWRKAWAKNWDSVKYCSDACRAKKASNK